MFVGIDSDYWTVSLRCRGLTPTLCNAPSIDGNRVRDLGRPIHPSIAKQILPMQSTINELFQKLIPDLEGPNAFRYQRSVSPGIQEYMEAVLFQHYLEHQQLMSYETVASTLPAGIMLTYDDYLLGIFDMTGELMRFAITYVAANGYHPQSDEGGATQALLADMQDLRTHLELLNTEGSHGLSREFEQKLKTTRNSVEKVENSVYSITVRGSERPKGWRPDASSTDPPREIDQAIEA